MMFAKEKLHDDRHHYRPCLWSRIASVSGWINFPVTSAMPTGSMVRSARPT
jgi:hypothetical protein